jgi:hypothetical protein
VSVPVAPSRVAARSHLRRARRRRRLQGIAAALALALVLAAVASLVLVRSTPDPQVDVGELPRTQTTLLVQVVGPGGDAVSTALLGVDPPSGEAAGLLVPPQVLVGVAGAGTVPVGSALRSAAPDDARAGLADLLEVTIDGGWGLPQPLLAELVDRLGGVEAEVDVPAAAGPAPAGPAAEGPAAEGPAGPGPGRQRLDGQSAVRLLGQRAPQEDETARLARQQQVLAGLLAALPETDGDLLGLLRSVGDRSVTGLELPELARVLGALRDAARDDAVRYDALPVVPADAAAAPGDGVRADPPAVQAVVDRLLAQSVPPGVRDAGNRVLVLDGAGLEGLGGLGGLGERARERLEPAGFVYVGVRADARQDHAGTQVLVPEASPQARALGQRVADAVGLPDSTVATADLGLLADVVVLVGADFPS